MGTLGAEQWVTLGGGTLGPALFKARHGVAAPALGATAAALSFCPTLQLQGGGRSLGCGPSAAGSALRAGSIYSLAPVSFPAKWEKKK